MRPRLPAGRRPGHRDRHRDGSLHPRPARARARVPPGAQRPGLGARRATGSSSTPSAGDDVAPRRLRGGRRRRPGWAVRRDAGRTPSPPGSSTEVELDFTLTLGPRRLRPFRRRRRASPGGPAAPRCWPGNRASAGRGTRSSTWSARPPAARSWTPRSRVSAPEDLTVLMTGARAEPRRPGTAAAPGRRPSRSPGTSASPRACSRRRSATTPDGVSVTVGVLPGGDVPAAQLAQWTTRRDRRPGRPRRALPVPHAHGGPVARLRRRHRVPEHDLRGDARAARCWCTRSRTCGSTGWSATPSSAIRGWTRRSPPGPRRSSTATAGWSTSGRARLTGAVGASMAEFPDDRNYFSARLRQGRRRAARRPRRRPARRPSTPRSAATSTPTPGRSRPRRTSTPPSRTCRPRCPPLHRRAGPRQGRRPALAGPRRLRWAGLSGRASSRCIRVTPSTRSSSPSA